MASVFVLLIYLSFYLWPAFLVLGGIFVYAVYRQRRQATTAAKLILLVIIASLGLIMMALGLFGGFAQLGI